MFARLAIVFILTGLGHLLSIIVFKYASKNIDSDTLSDIAQIDSHVQLILTLIALGLQTSAIRDIAVSENWKQDYQKTQSARLSLGIILLLITLFIFSDKVYLIYLISPILAMNSDYVLYARGYAVFGSAIAFLRLSIPLIFLFIFSMYFKQYVIHAYITCFFVIYIISNSLIRKYLNISESIKPKIKDLTLYLKSLPMGLITLGFYFLGLGMIIVADFFYSNSEISITFVLIKFYVIFKGVLRIIHQSFIKEMQDEMNCLKIDKLSILISISILGSIIFFPNTFTIIIFGEKFLTEENLILVVGICIVVYSLFLSLATRAMLLKKDSQYLKIVIVSVFSSVLILTTSHYLNHNKIWILLSILFGEIILSLGLAISFSSIRMIIKRVTFVLKTCFLLIFPFTLSLFCNDTIYSFLVSFSLFIVFSVLLNFKELKLSNPN